MTISNQIIENEIYIENNLEKDIIEIYSKKIGFLGFYVKENNLNRYVFKPNVDIFYKVHYLIKIIEMLNKLNCYEKSEVKI